MFLIDTYKMLIVAAFLAICGLLQASVAAAEMPAGRCMSVDDCYDGNLCNVDECVDSQDGCGDTNDDGTVSAPDALLICRAALGLSACDLSVCDLDGNGRVTASDALVLMTFIVGIPAEMVCMGECEYTDACEDGDFCTIDSCDEAVGCRNDPAPHGYGMDILDFEGLPAGTILESVVSVDGATIGVDGLNPNFGAAVDAAVIFDSSCSTGTCTGGDWDLGSPNEAFGGPGIGEGGASGVGTNSTSLGGVLIVTNNLNDNNGDGLVDNPGDLSQDIVMLEFDFSSLGGVSLYELTIIDVESNEMTPNVKLYGSNGALKSTVTLPSTGDNGVRVVQLPSNSGVHKAVVTLRGSGAIDNVAFSTGDVCL